MSRAPRLLAAFCLLSWGVCCSATRHQASGPDSSSPRIDRRDSPVQAPPATAQSPLPQADRACTALSVDLPPAIEIPAVTAPIPPIVGGDTLAPLYDSLARLLRGRATDHVRLGLYGDSNVVQDYLTGYMRRQLQSRYGDAGHGFVAPGRPWRWSGHMDVDHGVDKARWSLFTLSTRPVADGAYGVSGIAAQASEAGAPAWVGTAPDDSPIGRTADRFGLFYLERPGAGSLEIRADGEPLATIDASAPELAVKLARFELPDAPHRIDMVTTSDRPFRFLGSYLERSTPGIVVDCYGIGGTSYGALTWDDDAVTQSMMRLRPNDLIVFWLGTNLFEVAPNAGWLKDLVAVRRKVDAALPILIMSPPDHVQDRQKPVTSPGRVEFASALQSIAADNGCAYWDFWTAMGGNASIARFADAGLASGDLYHLSRSGSEYMASRFVHALWQDFARWLAEHPRAGCGVTSPPSEPRVAHRQEDSR